MEKRKDIMENIEIKWDDYTSGELGRQMDAINEVLERRRRENDEALSRFSRRAISEDSEQRGKAGRPRLTDEEKERKRAERRAARNGSDAEFLSDADLREEE